MLWAFLSVQAGFGDAVSFYSKKKNLKKLLLEL